jgi:hypothetical protein
MINYSCMDYSKVKGLVCNVCDIASCTTSVMRTPVSRHDAFIKEADMDRLEWDEEKKMYFIIRNEDKTCSFFDPIDQKCSLPLERRFNSCLVYPIRVYESPYGNIYLIVNKQCPSALGIFDMYARREPSTVAYVETARQIYEDDEAYYRHVLDKTKGFSELLILDIFNGGIKDEVFSRH